MRLSKQYRAGAQNLVFVLLHDAPAAALTKNHLVNFREHKIRNHCNRRRNATAAGLKDE